MTTISANAKKRTASQRLAQAPRRGHPRHARLRKKVSGTPARPRLAVNRSSRHIVVQLIDDLAGPHAGLRRPRWRPTSGRSTATRRPGGRKVGELVAERAREAGVTAVVFDRGGYDYHGRIAALADAAREGGLEF